MKFSEDIKVFLEDAKTANTLENLLQVIKGKSFALMLFVLMLPAALPIPTAGITHVLEVVTVLVALQMIVLRPFLWLPHKVLKTEVKWASDQKFVSGLDKFLVTIERYARPRLASWIESKAGYILTGIIVVVFATAAFFAPLATGLDTLPALGVVVLGLAIIFEDIVMWLAGIIIGIAGVALVLIAYTLGIEAIIAVGKSLLHLLGL
jgi:hypothetical protein